METLFIPNENDFKKWIKEAVDDSIKKCAGINSNCQNDDCLLNRTEIAKLEGCFW